MQHVHVIFWESRKGVNIVEINQYLLLEIVKLIYIYIYIYILAILMKINIVILNVLCKSVSESIYGN